MFGEDFFAGAPDFGFPLVEQGSLPNLTSGVGQRESECLPLFSEGTKKCSHQRKQLPSQTKRNYKILKYKYLIDSLFILVLSVQNPDRVSDSEYGTSLDFGHLL